LGGGFPPNGAHSKKRVRVNGPKVKNPLPPRKRERETSFLFFFLRLEESRTGSFQTNCRLGGERIEARETSPFRKGCTWFHPLTWPRPSPSEPSYRGEYRPTSIAFAKGGGGCLSLSKEETRAFKKKGVSPKPPTRSCGGVLKRSLKPGGSTSTVKKNNFCAKTVIFMETANLH